MTQLSGLLPGGVGLGSSDLGTSDLGGSDLGGSDLGGSDLGGSVVGAGRGSAIQEQVAALLSRPGSVYCTHRPIVALDDGRCLGHEAGVRVADAGDTSFSPWFQAATQTGLGGRLGALALAGALRQRATMPGERFLLLALDPETLSHPDVLAVLAAEDDISDLTVTLVGADLPAGHRIGPILAQLRGRGMNLAISTGLAGVHELTVLERLGPDLVVLPGALIRGVAQSRLRQRLVDVAVELAEDTGASTLAEEVESLDEIRTLRDLGVRMANGWLFGRPRQGFPKPPPEICEWLRQRVQ